MTARLRASVAVVIACAVASCVAVARSADAPSPAKAHPAVGTMTLVLGRVLDLHAGAKHPVLLRNRALVLADDVLTPARGASARVLFAPGVKRRSGVLFTLRAPHAATQQILVGAAFLGPRIAFGYDGRSIESAAGRGLDAAARVSVSRVRPGRVRLRLSAPGALHPTFACAVDRRHFAACVSSQVLRLAAGRHAIAVRTTSLFGFHGPSTIKRITVTR